MRTDEKSENRILVGKGIKKQQDMAR